MLAEKISFTDEIVTTPLHVSYSDSDKKFSLELEIYVQSAQVSVRCNCCKKPLERFLTPSTLSSPPMIHSLMY